jgi:Uma2 family endonuclease
MTMDIETTPINYRRTLVAGNIHTALRQHVDAHRLGRVLPGGLYYVLWKASAGVRLAQVPDVSFLRPDKLRVFDPTLPYPGAPDFAVECVTVTEADMITLEKVRDYLAAGTEEVWIVYVGLKEIHRYRRDEARVIRAFLGDDVINGGSMFPGLQLVTSELFA